MLDNVIPLEVKILEATRTLQNDHGALGIKVWAVLDGTVYFSTKIFRDTGLPCRFL